MKRSITFLTILLPFVCVAEDKTDTDISKYQEVIYAQATEVERSNIKLASIQMKNPKTQVKGFQFDMYLPEQLEFVISAKDGIVPKLSLQRTTAAATDYFSYCIQPDGALRVLCYSSELTSFSNTSGEICTIPIKPKSNTLCGNYPVIVKNIVYSDGTRQTVSDEIISSVLSYISGDVNGDSNVDVADVIRLLSSINGTPSETIIKPAADLDRNQTIDNKDAERIFTMILQGTANK